MHPMAQSAYISRLPAPVRPSRPAPPAHLPRPCSSAPPAAGTSESEQQRKIPAGTKLTKPKPKSARASPSPARTSCPQHQQQQQQHTRPMAPRQPPARGPRPLSRLPASSQAPNPTHPVPAPTAAPAQVQVLYGPRPRRKLVSPRKPSLPPSPSHIPTAAALVYTGQVHTHHPVLVPCPDPQALVAAPSSPAPAPRPPYYTPAHALAPAAAVSAAVQQYQYQYQYQYGSAGPAPAYTPAPAAAGSHPASLIPGRRPSRPTTTTMRTIPTAPAPALSRRSTRRRPSTSAPSAKPHLPPIKLSGLPLPVGPPPRRKSPIGEKAHYRDVLEEEVRELLAPLAPGGKEEGQQDALGLMTPPKTPPPPPAQPAQPQRAQRAQGPMVHEQISVLPRRAAPPPLSLVVLSSTTNANGREAELDDEDEDTPITTTAEAEARSPGRIRQKLAAELPLARPTGGSLVHRRPALRHVSVPASLAPGPSGSSTGAPSGGSSYGSTPEREFDPEMELEFDLDLDLDNILVFAGESSGSSGAGFPTSTVFPDGLGPGPGLDTPFEPSELWREVEGLLSPPSQQLPTPPASGRGSFDAGAGAGAGAGRAELAGKGPKEGPEAYVPVFGPALAAALSRTLPPQPRTPSSASPLHSDVNAVLRGLTLSDEEWEDQELDGRGEAEGELELDYEEDAQTPVVERVRRVFARRPTLSRSGRSVRRKGTRKL
ncbi:hypothetical protein CALCODRAFT_102928 [Calocera cornea HHB12733]|uniref:Uncharacterized protein n=1 Tax=Calocera cornea HHB12733 TaxID=1353952 RepID=A0A165D5D1_9BASI|nr:hypothetical protein CALCODRAFT_102928 [Calocera cornea HHB12733]